VLTGAAKDTDEAAFPNPAEESRGGGLWGGLAVWMRGTGFGWLFLLISLSEGWIRTLIMRFGASAMRESADDLRLPAWAEADGMAGMVLGARPSG